MTEIDDELREGFLDAGAQTLADIRKDWDCQKQLIAAENRERQADLDALLAPLRERIARLEGQMTVLLGGDSTNSPTRSKRSKQSPVNDHGRLLEHRPR
jgi:hypothetical protein